MSWKFSGSPHPCFWGHSQVARSIRAATGFSSLAMVLNPRRPASKGMDPPPAVMSNNTGEVPEFSARNLGLCRKDLWFGNEMLDHCPVAFTSSICRRAVTTSGEVPMLLMNSARFASSGSIDAATVARDTIRGRPGPPDVKLVYGRVPCECSALSDCFHADFVDGQPILDESAALCRLKSFLPLIPVGAALLFVRKEAIFWIV